MLGSIFAWMASGTGLTVLGGMLTVLGLTGGAVAVRRYRKKRTQKMKKDVVGAVRAHKTAVAETPRGKLKARRKAQPKRLTAGHRRTPDDPTRTRVIARKAKEKGVGLWGKWKISRANRKAAKQPKRLELLPGTPAAPGSHECRAPIPRPRGRTAHCSRIVATPGEHCWQHGGGKSAA